MNQNTKRLFISLEVPQEIKDKIALTLTPRFEKVIWQPPENYHITVKFIGDAPQELTGALSDFTDFLGRSFSPFLVNFGAVKVVESRLRLMVKNPQEIMDLRATVEHNLKKINIERDDPQEFEPHLTLARTPYNYSPPPLQIDLSQFSFVADRIVLLETLKGENAATFIPLKAVRFSADK